MYEAPGQRLECISSGGCNGNCPDHRPSVEEGSIDTLKNSSSFKRMRREVISYLILPFMVD